LATEPASKVTSGATDRARGQKSVNAASSPQQASASLPSLAKWERRFRFHGIAERVACRFESFDITQRIRRHHHRGAR
jgi:hypothetical protein